MIARRSPIGIDHGQVPGEVKPISASTTSRGKSFAAACASTRASWLDSRITSSTPVTASHVSGDFAQDVAVEDADTRSLAESSGSS